MDEKTKLKVVQVPRIQWARAKPGFELSLQNEKASP